MRHLRTIWLVLGWAWVGVVIFISLTPNPPEPVRFWNADKLEHALAYGLLMLWFAQIYLQHTSRLLAAGLLILLGVSLEILQSFTGYRFFEVADMVANTTGVLLGWVWARTDAGRIYAALEARLNQPSVP
ncbi:MAG: VanZ family protein [Gallionella sp.]|jgi:VanZ family protein|nr:VanZ family protein [Gallionella sp.]